MLFSLRWDQATEGRVAVVAGEEWLAAGLAAAMAGEATATDETLETIAAVVAARRHLAAIPVATLAPSTLTVLFDPTEDERLLAVQVLAGRPAARLRIVPSVAAIARAEHAVLLMLTLTRRLFHAYSEVVRGTRRPGVASRLTDAGTAAPNWVAMPEPGLLYGKTLGILGLGRSGEALACRAAALGMRVIYHDRARRPAAELRIGAVPRRFDQVLREADVVSLHLPLTPETLRIIDAPELALMKPTALLINTAHGRLVDEGSLIKALRQRAIAGAGLDVFAYEPLPADSPLLALDNVALTPHVATVSPETARAEAIQAIARILRDETGPA